MQPLPRRQRRKERFLKGLAVTNVAQFCAQLQLRVEGWVSRIRKAYPHHAAEVSQPFVLELEDIRAFLMAPETPRASTQAEGDEALSAVSAALDTVQKAVDAALLPSAELEHLEREVKRAARRGTPRQRLRELRLEASPQGPRAVVDPWLRELQLVGDDELARAVTGRPANSRAAMSRLARR